MLEYTSSGLPVTSEGVREVTERDIMRRIKEAATGDFADDFFLAYSMLGGLIEKDEDLNNYSLDLVTKITNERSFEGLGKILRETPAIGVLIGFQLCYEILDRQGEANKLEEQFGDDPKS